MTRTRNSARALLGYALALSVFLPLTGHAAPIDYVLPGDVIQPKARLTAALDSLECPECSSVVSYTSFSSTRDTYTLTRFPGRHVALLLPDAWLGETGLTVDERSLLVELLDIDYQWMAELIGQEPKGDGKATLAVVATCSYGCAIIGEKGAEIAPRTLEEVRADLAQGKLASVVVHALNHNFDVYYNLYAYGPDPAHRWTDLLDDLVLIHGRIGTRDLSPEGVQARALREYFDPYFDDPANTWKKCVRDQLCGPELGMRTWAGVSQRIASLQEPGAMRRYFNFFRRQRLAGVTIADTPEAREDNHVEALAAAANVNLSCTVDAWRWQASSAARQRMSEKYGDTDLDCGDADGDGYSRVTGDCDDQDASRHPGAEELDDGIDRDCSGAPDGATIREPQGADFAPNTDVGFPATIEGMLGAEDGDDFGFVLPAPGAVEIELCSTSDMKGWVFVYTSGGAWLDYQYTGPRGCSVHQYTLSEARRWRFSVSLNAKSSPGTYRVRVHSVPSPVKAPWTVTPRASCLGEDLRMPLTVAERPGFLRRPDTVRFWVRGAGFVAEVPYASTVSGTWRPPAVVQAGRYAYRAQAYRGAVPVSGLSDAATFLMGSQRRDVIVSTGEAHTILGLGGDDTLRGEGGRDRLCGGEGNDLLRGGSGNDWLDGGVGTDLCDGGGGSNETTACEPAELYPRRTR